MCPHWGSWTPCPWSSPTTRPAHCPGPPGTALDYRHVEVEKANAAASHTGRSSPGSWRKLPRPWRCLQPEPGVSAGASSTQLRREKESLWDQTQVCSIPLPSNACARSILEAQMSLKIMLWIKPLNPSDKDHPFTTVYRVLFGLILSYLSLASSPTIFCLTSFTPDTLALFQALVLVVLLATTGPLHMIHLECSSLFLHPVNAYSSFTSQLHDHFLKSTFADLSDKGKLPILSSHHTVYPSLFHLPRTILHLLGWLFN